MNIISQLSLPGLYIYIYFCSSSYSEEKQPLDLLLKLRQWSLKLLTFSKECKWNTKNKNRFILELMKLNVKKTKTNLQGLLIFWKSVAPCCKEEHNSGYKFCFFASLGVEYRAFTWRLRPQQRGWGQTQRYSEAISFSLSFSRAHPIAGTFMPQGESGIYAFFFWCVANRVPTTSFSSPAFAYILPF